MPALLGEYELLAARTCLVVLPGVLHKALVLQPLQKWVQRSALDAGEAVLPEDLGDGIAMILTVAEHREHCLRQSRTRQLLIKVDVIHK